MPSPQTLSEADRRLIAAWAADCADHVLPVYENALPDDSRPRELIEQARAFARGDISAQEAIRRRFESGVPAAEVARMPAVAAAARAAGQAAAVAHMGAHGLGAAGYAAQAAGLATPHVPGAVTGEVDWQVQHMSSSVKAALRQLPPVGENRAGPLGPGLLTAAPRGAIIRQLQAALLDAAPPESPVGYR